MEQIAIRTVQHFLYCPHRWGLVEIGRMWQENTFVVQGNLTHEKVDSKLHDFTSADKITVSSLNIYEDTLEIYGVADCVEFIKNRNGAYIEALKSTYKVKIIEYKPTQKKSDMAAEADEMQLFEQKLCIDKLFCCDSEAYFYFSDTRKRVKVEFAERYDVMYKKLTDCLSQMRSCLQSGTVPPIRKNQHCGGCSMKDMCMPKKRNFSVRKAIIEAGENI